MTHFDVVLEDEHKRAGHHRNHGVRIGSVTKKMADCRWLKPVLVARLEFIEWTGDHHLRHTKFMGLRGDTRPHDVRRE